MDEEWEKSFLYNSSAHTKFEIKEFVNKAAAAGKIPVFAPIDCRATWLDDSDMTATGKLDDRVVEAIDGAPRRADHRKPLALSPPPLVKGARATLYRVQQS